MLMALNRHHQLESKVDSQAIKTEIPTSAVDVEVCERVTMAPAQ